MAAENKYADEELRGNKVIVRSAIVEVAAADDDTSVYRMFKNVPADMALVRLDVYHDAITGGTDYDIGIHQADSGAVVVKDVFADGLDLSSGASKDGLAAVTEEERMMPLWEIAGVASSKVAAPQYDITMTANTVGSAAGTVVFLGYFTQLEGGL